MNLTSFHTENKPLQTKAIFTTTEGKVVSIQLQANAELKEHSTKVPALLICIAGEVVFENEQGLKETLSIGDYVNIEPNIKHWLLANVASNLILIK